MTRFSTPSFGFGGTNAHAILESYEPGPQAFVSSPQPPSDLLFTPLVFSAASESSLHQVLSRQLDYLKVNPTTKLADLAYTLQHRRSTLPYRKSVIGPTLEDMTLALESLVNPPDSNNKVDLAARHAAGPRSPKLLGIFTGQGAQWPRMGAQLIESSAFAASRIAELDAALANLPISAERPSWSIRDELLAGKTTSRIAEAALSQPLCTAVQIVLVDILRAAGIFFAAVVGHSSGEIGAAYAAGLLSAEDAIRTAYFRGVHAKLASSPNDASQRGAMIAVGCSVEEAHEFCSQEQFAGRLQVAAVNSSSSVTLSGDEDAVDEAIQTFVAKSTFARKLKVDTAYHSVHMASCAGPYLESMRGSSIQPLTPSQHVDTIWFSSVKEGTRMYSGNLDSQYWVDNMCNAVLFAGALAHAVEEAGPFDLCVEIGPHPALKGPVMANLEELGPGKLPYTGLLGRGKSDIAELSGALGYIWETLGHDSVQFSAVEALLAGTENAKVLTGLPLYPFDHQRSYWVDSRVANHFKHRRTIDAPSPVLGTPCSESITPGEFQWRNILRPSEIAWLSGHKLQGQIVFPATGYVSMAVEAMKTLAHGTGAGTNTEISMIRLTDMNISRAIVFNDDGDSVETIFSVSSIETSSSLITADWACYSIGDKNAVNLNAKGRAFVNLSAANPDTLPLARKDQFNLVKVQEDAFYSSLSKVGYHYSPPFQGLTDIQRKPDSSFGKLVDQSGSAWEDNLVLHPGMLDSALQAAFAAWTFPGDRQLWGLHVPVSIDSITINPYFTQLGAGGKQKSLQFESFIRNKGPNSVEADIYLYSEDGSHSIIQTEGARLVPFSPATEDHDTPIFAHFRYGVLAPDGELAGAGEKLSQSEVQLYRDIDRIAYWFVRQARAAFPLKQREGMLQHFQYYLRWCDYIADMVSEGRHSKVMPEHNSDTRADIDKVLARYEGRKDIRFVQVVGDHLLHVLRTGTSMLEFMNKDGLLNAFYEDGLVSGPNNRWLARVVAQVAHRFPAMNILEVGAGTGATSKSIISALGPAFSSYTFTDVSASFLLTAEQNFSEESDRMVYKTFDMEHEPSTQDFVEGFHDVVVAMNVLHIMADLEASMANVRRLLKPGGYLIVGEVTATDPIFSGMTVGTLPGWWVGAETGRPWGPALTLPQWDSVLKKTGFAGIDTTTPDISTSLPISVFVAQAVDERVTLLRNPVAAEELPPSVRTGTLAMIGGSTLSVCDLTQDIADIMPKFFHQTEVFDTIEAFASSDLVSRSASGSISVLVLTDLDQPYMQNFTVGKFEALKDLWAVANTLVWVTRGSRDDNPYNYMMVGIGRVVKREYPNLNWQLFDLDSKTEVRSTPAIDLATAFLRHHVIGNWGADATSLLWGLEPEIYVEDGRQLVPRVLPDREKNRRVNARHRSITAAVNPAKETLELVGVGKGESRALELHQPSPLKLVATPSSESRTVRVTQSLLQNVAVGEAGFFRLFLGVDIKTNETVLAISSSSESPVIIPAQWSISVGQATSGSTLASVATNLIADRILSLTPIGSTLIVNEADQALVSVLQSKAERKNAKTLFVTAELQKNTSGSYVFLHPNLPKSIIQSQIPDSTAVFVHFSRGAASDAVRDSIANYLPATCLRLSEEALVSHKVATFSADAHVEAVCKALEGAWDTCEAYGSSISNVETITLESVGERSVVGENLAVVDWTAEDSVTVKVQPVDTGLLFHPDRTYLFVGLAGEMGQSLAAWMIAHGARYIVLTSRTPRVSEKFIAEAAERYGAVVKPISLDITSPRSLRSCHAAITATLPPIAGVVNGAMVLQDRLFSDMVYDQFTRVLEPKVLGTQLLDELFRTDKSLDFFICMSSIIVVHGFLGQSNYAAANAYMISLINQRRKRGLVGSAMDISAVVGIGYAAQEDNFNYDWFESIRYLTIGEDDLYALFAEAIVSGRPGKSADVSAEVISGINFISADYQLKDSDRRDIKFEHFTLRQERSTVTQGHGASVPVKAQLQSVSSKEEAYSVIRDAFVVQLKRILRILEDETLDDSGPLIEQGVDSLVAVDIRTWFLKEVGVDVPVLKVLGGSSIADIVTTALEKMDLVSIQAQGQDEAKPKSQEPTPSLRELPTKHKPSVEQFTHSETDISTPALSDSSVFEITAYPTPYSLESATSTPPSEPLSYFYPRKSHGVSEKVQSEVLKLAELEETSPMSFGQARFWFLQHFLKDKTCLNFSALSHISGRLSVAKFERALDQVIQRHEALRTRFLWPAIEGGGEENAPLLQGVSALSPSLLEKRTIPSEKEARSVLQELQEHEYNLEGWGAIRMVLLTESDTSHYFVFGCHHIALDGQSVHILFHDLDRAYCGLHLDPVLPDGQYRAFAAKQRTDYEQRQTQELEYFKSVVGSQDPGAIDLFPIAKNKGRVVLESYKQVIATARLDGTSAHRVKQLARKLHSTNFHVYLAVLQAWLFKQLPEQQELFIGIADSNRIESRFTNTIGCLVNLLPLKFSRGQQIKLGDAVRATRNQVYGALQHSRLPFDVLLNELGMKRSGKYTPIFQVFMDYQQRDKEKVTLCGLDTEFIWNSAATGYDIALEVLDSPSAKGESLLVLKLQDSLYTQAQAELLLESYVHVLGQLTNDSAGGEALLSKPSLWARDVVQQALTMGRGEPPTFLEHLSSRRG